MSVELFERMQGVIDGRNARKTHAAARDFAFSTLVSCGHCGCAMVGELKKGKYVYYHCTGYKGKCPEPYVREEVLSEKFGAVLGSLRFGENVLEWLREAILQSHEDEAREHTEALTRLQAQYDRVQARLHAMYIDKLDGRIDAAYFDKLSEDWRREQDRCLREIQLHQGADQSYLEEGIGLLELAQNSQNLFAKQAACEKRRILNFVLSNSTWKNGELSVALRQPFDLIAEMIGNSPIQDADGVGFLPPHLDWLPILKSFRTLFLRPPPELRAVLQDFRYFSAVT